MDISIVIVNYKSRGLIKNLLKSIETTRINPTLQVEIIVVDNDSRDGIEKLLAETAHVIYIQSGSNIGFGAAQNIGLKRATGRYALILNPDTVFLKKGVLEDMYAYMESHHEVGIIAPRLVRPNKELIYSAFRFPKLIYPLFARTPLGRTQYGQEVLKYYRYEDVDHYHTFDIDWAQGSCLLVRSDLLKKLHYFDERFFMYLEDTDLCRRVWEAGFRVVYFADTEIVHYYSRGDADKPFYQALFTRLSRIHLQSWYRYFSKWKGQEINK